MSFQGSAMPSSASADAGRTFYRVAEVAARFEIDETTVYRQIKAGRLKAVRIGSGRGTVRVPAEALAEYEASIAAAAKSAELTVDTPLGSVDLVAIERARSGHQVELTRAESAFLALVNRAAVAGVAA
jgi:excisionase family DNA binding protein